VSFGFFEPQTGLEPAYDGSEIVCAAFNWFREHGFPYKGVAQHVAMQEINDLRCMSVGGLLNTTVGHTIADTYHRHRFHVRCDGKLSPVDAYDDDERLMKAVSKMWELQHYIPQRYISSLGWTSNAQAAANFRPGWSAMMYRRYCPVGGTVLDTSAGFGGRLVGAIASGCVANYIGIDPAIQTCRANWRLYRDLGVGKLNVRLISLPAEDVDCTEFAGRCDMALTSPPYWAKEHYSNEDTQSWKRYSTGDHWREGFLRRMLELQYKSLKPGGTNVVCVADVTVGSRRWPIVDWVETIGAEVGFAIQARQPYPLNRVPGRGTRPQRMEVGCILEKSCDKQRQRL
jgi:hypothetical protein